MSRFFNTAGPCDPRDHYMLPPEARLPELGELIAKKAYFVVHAPRQSGKTTTLRHAARQLLAEGGQLALYASCESGASGSGDVDVAVSAILSSIERQAEELPGELRPLPAAGFERHKPNSRLLRYLTAWCKRSPLPVVLFLDEIDALRDDALLSVLRQLREGYSDRPRRFPQTIALIGLRDVRDYKIPLRPGLDRLGTSSPFNVKIESLTLPNFTAAEVAALYAQHTAETGQVFRPEASALAWELTRGQPWLVNALARQVVEREVPARSTAIEVEHVEAAKEALIQRRDTHLDSLVDRLREPRLRRVIEPILSGEIPGARLSEDDLGFAEDLGLVVRGPAGLEIANPIYREVIPRALTSVTESLVPFASRAYVDDEGRLRLERLLADFADFWRQHAEALLSQQAYGEAAAQLVFMAFLQRLVNGGGFIDREYAVGSGRIDLCVRWPLAGGGVERFALELKVWRDSRPDPQPQGLEQLRTYLERLGLERGTLMIFDQRRMAPPVSERGEKQEIEYGGRRIAVWRL